MTSIYIECLFPAACIMLSLRKSRCRCTSCSVSFRRCGAPRWRRMSGAVPPHMHQSGSGRSSKSRARAPARRWTQAHRARTASGCSGQVSIWRCGPRTSVHRRHAQLVQVLGASSCLQLASVDHEYGGMVPHVWVPYGLHGLYGPISRASMDAHPWPGRFCPT